MHKIHSIKRRITLWIMLERLSMGFFFNGNPRKIGFLHFFYSNDTNFSWNFFFEFFVHTLMWKLRRFIRILCWIVENYSGKLIFFFCVPRNDLSSANFLFRILRHTFFCVSNCTWIYSNFSTIFIVSFFLGRYAIRCAHYSLLNNLVGSLDSFERGQYISLGSDLTRLSHSS